MSDLYSLTHWGDGGEWCHVCQEAQPCAGIRAQFALLEGQIRAVVALCEDHSGQSARMLAHDILTALGRDPDDEADFYRTKLSEIVCRRCGRVLGLMEDGGDGVFECNPNCENPSPAALYTVIE